MRSLILPMCIWILLIINCRAQDSKAICYQLIRKMDQTVVSHVEGEMNFVVIFDSGDNTKREFAGILGWRFPNARWEYTEQLFTDRGASFDKRYDQIVLDGPSEVVHQNSTTHSILRCPDKSRKLDYQLCVLPWQSWIELDQSMTFKDLLKGLADEPAGRKVEATTSSDSKVLITVTTVYGSRLEMSFQHETGLPLSYKTSGTEEEPNFSGSFEWTTINQNIFPLRIVKHHPTTSKTGRVTEMVFSNHRTKTKFTDREFTFNSLDLSSIREIQTFRKGQPLKVEKLSKQNKESKLVELSERMKTVGFAKE